MFFPNGFSLATWAVEFLVRPIEEGISVLFLLLSDRSEQQGGIFLFAVPFLCVCRSELTGPVDAADV